MISNSSGHGGVRHKGAFLGQKEHTSFESYNEGVSKLSKMAEQVELTIIREAIKYGRMEFQRNVSV
jgi:hypothetical protein